jgi:hypothetical protein
MAEASGKLTRFDQFEWSLPDLAGWNGGSGLHCHVDLQIGTKSRDAWRFTPGLGMACRGTSFALIPMHEKEARYAGSLQLNPGPPGLLH